MDPVSSDGGAADHAPLSVAEVRARCLRTTRAGFEAEHPHPWLLCDLEVPASAPEASFSTAQFLDDALAPPRPGDSLQHAALEPRRYGFFALHKTPKNPWKDRILIGRATNNDVVVRHPSVSKVHARATQKDGAWTLADARSTNGTWVDGVRLPAGGAAPLGARSAVRLGSVACTLLTSGDVHDALTRR